MSDAAAPETAAASAAAPSLLDDAWAIFGASSGIARPFARAAASSGKALLLAGRDPEDLDLDARDLVLRGSPAVRTLPFEALDPAMPRSMAATLDAALPGPFNALIAFGAFGTQAAMAAGPSRPGWVMAPNATATIALMLALAPLMERRGAGRLVAIGSAGGDRVRNGTLVYGASKAALHGACAALRARLARSGVGLTLAKPGPIDTAMTLGLDLRVTPADAGACGRDLWLAAQRGRAVRYFPARWRWISLALRALPDAAFHRLRL